MKLKLDLDDIIQTIYESCDDSELIDLENILVSWLDNVREELKFIDEEE